jgi:hypothetical protein
MKTFEVMNEKYIRYNPATLVVEKEEDAMELIGNSYSIGKILIFQSNLPPDFFDLSTGLAGEILQKLTNYQIRTAFVIDKENEFSDYFNQLLSEANTKLEYRFFYDEELARKWLESLN